MKIYLLSQEENSDYDTYDSCVVIAENEEDAKTIAPDNDVFKPNEKYGSWAKSIEDISVEYIGEADPSQIRGVVCASFNAG